MLSGRDMTKGKTQRVVVWGLGLIAAALLLLLGRPLLEAVREGIFPDPARAIVGSWIRARQDPEDPDILFEFTASKSLIARSLADSGRAPNAIPYRIADIDGRRMLLLGPDPVDGAEGRVQEVPFSFESRDVIVIGDSRFRRGEASGR